MPETSLTVPSEYDIGAVATETYNDLPPSVFSDYPNIVLSKEAPEFVIKIGSNIISRPKTLLVVLAGRKNFYGRRSYFRQNDLSKPVCSTPLCNPGRNEIQYWHGHNNETNEDYKCIECENFEFGSPCRPVRMPWMFLFDNKINLMIDNPARITIPVTSVQACDSMIKLASQIKTASGNPIPLEAVIFELSCKVITKQYKYGMLVVNNVAGFLPIAKKNWIVTQADMLHRDLAQWRAAPVEEPYVDEVNQYGSVNQYDEAGRISDF